jgi:hypothetical protein
MAAQRRHNFSDVYWRSYWLDYQGNVVRLPAVEARFFSSLSCPKGKFDTYRHLFNGNGNSRDVNGPGREGSVSEVAVFSKTSATNFTVRSTKVINHEPSSNPQNGGTSLVGCPWLLIQFIHANFHIHIHNFIVVTRSQMNSTHNSGARRLLLGCVGRSSPVTGLEWPRGFQEVKVPRFHDNGTGWW